MEVGSWRTFLGFVGFVDFADFDSLDCSMNPRFGPDCWDSSGEQHNSRELPGFVDLGFVNLVDSDSLQ